MPDATPVRGLRYLKPSDAPDLSGGLYDLAVSVEQAMAPDRVYAYAKNTQQRSVPSGQVTTLVYDNLRSNPSGQMAIGSGNIPLPLAGIYRVHATQVINGGTNTTAPWWFRVKLFDATNGVSYPGRSGGIGWITDAAIDFETEFAATAGSTAQVEFWQGSGNTANVPGYTDDEYRQSLFVRYVGPA